MLDLDMLLGAFVAGAVWRIIMAQAPEKDAAAVESKIARLEALRGELKRVVSAACHGHVSDCRVIEVLSNHELCEGDHAEPEAATVA